MSLMPTKEDHARQEGFNEAMKSMESLILQMKVLQENFTRATTLLQKFVTAVESKKVAYEDFAGGLDPVCGWCGCDFRAGAPHRDDCIFKETFTEAQKLLKDLSTK